MQFEYPQYLLLLLIAPVVFFAAVYGSVRGRAKLNAFAKSGVWDRIRPYASVARVRARFALMFFGLCLVAFSASGPKFGTAFEQVRTRGLDVVIAIDTSDSMLAQDMRPDRLAFAKHEIEKILELLKGDRVALLPFSGGAYLLCPLTLDYSAIRMFLGVVDTDVIPTEGTDLAGAIDAARATFDQTERKFRVMILITDGEDLQGEGLEAAKRASEDGIVIFVLGIGTDQGVPIPVASAAGSVEYKKDKKGEVVLSRISEKTLTKVAALTGGVYVKASYDDADRDAIFARIDRMERKELEGRLVTRYKARYQWFLVPGLVFLALGLAIRHRKNGRTG
jgi:Ca-activated chloride channel family protein